MPFLQQDNTGPHSILKHIGSSSQVWKLLVFNSEFKNYLSGGISVSVSQLWYQEILEVQQLFSNIWTFLKPNRRKFPDNVHVMSGNRGKMCVSPSSVFQTSANPVFVINVTQCNVTWSSKEDSPLSDFHTGVQRAKGSLSGPYHGFMILYSNFFQYSSFNVQNGDGNTLN